MTYPIPNVLFGELIEPEWGNSVADEINKLGPDPEGGYPTVEARLDAITTTAIENATKGNTNATAITAANTAATNAAAAATTADARAVAAQGSANNALAQLAALPISAIDHAAKGASEAIGVGVQYMDVQVTHDPPPGRAMTFTCHATFDLAIAAPVGAGNIVGWLYYAPGGSNNFQQAPAAVIFDPAGAPAQRLTLSSTNVIESAAQNGTWKFRLYTQNIGGDPGAVTCEAQHTTLTVRMDA